MPADYRIRAENGLAYVRFSGHLTMAEVQACAEEFGRDPQNKLLHKHLVDFSQLTSYDDNVVEILQMQARLADLFEGDPTQWMFVYFAPTPLSREVANFGIRAWTGAPNVVIRMTTSESDTMDVLGLPGDTIAEALGNTAQT